MNDDEVTPEVTDVAGLRRAAETSPLSALSGLNFSGRTRLLRQLTGLSTGEGDDDGIPVDRGVFLGQAVAAFLSGIAGTVRDELLLHAENGRFGRGCEALLGITGLGRLLDRNPFTLSGGEQVCLAVVCGWLLNPRWFSIDCALEQLAVGLKIAILDAVGDMLGNGRCVVADNRLNEWRASVSGLRVVPSRGAPGGIRPHPVSAKPLDPYGPVTAPAIQLGGISFRYPQCPEVLRGVEVEFVPGRIHVLSGRNGAGKTTLARLLVGEHRPTGGRVWVGGREARLWERPADVVAYHYQNPDMQLFSTTVRGEIAAGMVGSGPPDRYAALATRAFGLEPFADDHPLDLPFVLRKRVALAATVAMGRPWLVLDEPTLGQDDETARAIADIITRLAECGAGIVVITHSPSFRRMLSAAEYVLDNGAVRPL